MEIKDQELMLNGYEIRVICGIVEVDGLPVAVGTTCPHGIDVNTNCDNQTSCNDCWIKALTCHLIS